jgi:hypothetical protein
MLPRGVLAKRIWSLAMCVQENNTMKNIQKALAAALCVGGAASAALSLFPSNPAQAQLALALPTPLAHVSNLDVECYLPEGESQPLGEGLVINHLNPVLQDMGIGEQKIKVGKLEEVCVPVAKNGKLPPRLARRYIAYTDLACYEARSDQEMNLSLDLSHLNPVLRELGLPDEKVVLGQLEQLCTPVEKRGAPVPDPVNRLVSQVDVACYAIEGKPAEVGLTLGHLNPLLSALPRHEVRVRKARHLCLPVAKDGAFPPDDVLQVVQWVDLKKYDVEADADVPPIDLVLRHLNPRFEGLESFEVHLQRPSTLAVPVAKNKKIPPSKTDD